MRLSAVPLLTAALAIGCATTTPSAPAPVPAEPTAKTAAPAAPPAMPPTDGALLLTGSVDAFTQSCAQSLITGKAEIARLKAMPAPRDTVAAITAFDDGMEHLNAAYSRAAIAENAHPDKAFREAAQACEQKLDQALTEISLDRGVYEAISTLDLKAQDAATQHWVAKTLRDFRRSGVDRDEATRTQVKALQEELVKIGQEFGQNIRDDVRTVELAPADLAGLPADFVRAHPVGPNGKVKVTTDNPDYNPFLAYAKSAKAREALWRAFRQRGHPKNLDTLARLVAKRTALAKLLGYPSYAAYATEDKMIKSPEAAAAFIEKISAASDARAKRDYATLLARKKKDVPGAKVVEPWDHPYYEDRVKAEQFAFDTQAVRPYFEYTKVKDGVLSTTGALFGVSYKAVKDAPVWHPDVEAYDLFDEGGAKLGRFYLDMHPRAGKYKHAAEWDLVPGQAGRRLPEAVLMCNFPKPGAEPALMQHNEVKTFFHEFGHLLHHLLAGRTRWAGYSGVANERDFVEAPSQFLEEWTWDPGVLQTFARHYQSNEPIPADAVKKMKRADGFGRGLWVRQQMFYAALSLQLYSREPATLDSTQLVREMQERYTPFKYAKDTFMQLSFGHLDGYSAVYYTYMWSLVIAKDLFTVFEQDGLMNRQVALRYRRSVLEPGGGKPAAELVHDFLGRDYAFDAYGKWLDREE